MVGARWQWRWAVLVPAAGVGASLPRSNKTAPHAGGFLALDWCDSSPVGPLARRSFALHASLADSLGIETGYRRMRTHSISVRQGQAGEQGACACAGAARCSMAALYCGEAEQCAMGPPVMRLWLPPVRWRWRCHCCCRGARAQQQPEEGAVQPARLGGA